MNRIISRIATTTCVFGSALVVVAPAVPQVSATPGGVATAGRKAVPHGFFESRRGHISKITSSRGSSRLVIDRAGTQHVITDVKAGTHTSHLMYLTRRPGHGGWTSHRIDGKRSDPAIEVEAHLAANRHQIFAVFYQCDAMYATEASVHARRLPAPKLVQQGDPDNCNDDNDDANVPHDFQPYERATAVGGNRLGVLGSDLTGTVWHVHYGTPGDASFPAGPTLPSAHQFTPFQITTDSSTGELLVDGAGVNDRGQEVDYVTTAKSVTAPWSKLVPIASLHEDTKTFFLSNIVAHKGRAYVGLERPVNDLSVGGHALYFVSRDASGKWSHPNVVRRTDSLDEALVLTLNSDTMRLHAAWTRHDTASKHKNGGIYQAVLSKNGKWSKPAQFTHFFADFPRDVEITPSGHAVITYRH